ncbi:FtsB family cell division protein [Mycolicibacterium fortuitum]|jgi:cell division protein FtsB|uniref:Septum formation initiator family protein n=2 Tax=Mycolicibacterium fortuitum TaxID=1766 RepID=A0AAE4VFD4_MYCFO|nr:septum formation initiator family protein [Mycolicibacterium fortuitum]MCA4754736.1 septum formation initiator family protein [Mycolicibacterium fortuitum]MCV7138146.1 septum formation initiator family protein [Mycolicibacterium fortuitum]MDV7190063.1 septum formation initiator family protein [Mycolicibacterium fortuitum]MDV7207229.1 septum formation initiator family protein [Mycolicibacterium fortuitum]MDV7228834.1 septum formation initiator family protein [Mycolicibacterium fortuitum]
MPEAKRPDPKRRSPASRPGKPGKAGESNRPRASQPRRRAAESRPAQAEPAAEETVTKAIAVQAQQQAELQSEQRFGSTARRAAILAAVVCVLTLTIAGPVRTYFAQRTEMKQLKASEEQLRAQIADLEQQKVKLADPQYIQAQARERLGFVMPGDTPYQVQLPPGAVVSDEPGELVPPGSAAPAGQPWYTSLWHTIADEPHGVSPTIGGPPAPGGPAPGGPPVPPPPPAEPRGPNG